MGHGFNFIAIASVRTNVRPLEVSLADVPKLQVCANACVFHFDYFSWVCSDVALGC